ncbi:hypothetical protein [Maribrevibacterium harenarium]|nr:hypothetical protein [Maribrevibacterium harenarium]
MIRLRTEHRFPSMTKPAKTKAETRQEIESLVDRFIREKGEIKQVKMGESGLQDGKYNTSHVGFGEPRKERTPLDHVVAALEQRKANKRAPDPKTKHTVKRRKKVIYDDFGEPLRWVWEE